MFISVSFRLFKKLLNFVQFVFFKTSNKLTRFYCILGSHSFSLLTELQTEEVLDCFWQNEKKHTPELICPECREKYDDLLNLFKSLQGYGKFCDKVELKKKPYLNLSTVLWME